MAYNPYDDVIDQDPAYMQEGGGTRTGLVEPVTTDQGPRYISSGIAKAYSLLTPEEETLQEIEKNKQLRELATAQALQGTKYEDYAGQADLPSFVVQSPGIKERLDQAGYQPQGFMEGMSRIGQFFYGDQRKAFDKLSQGQELTQEDRTAIALSPLDTLDFLFPPLALKKLASLGFKNVTDVLKASDDIPEVKQVKDYFGGAGFIPEGVMRAPDVGPKSISFRKFSPYDFKKLNKTVKDIKAGKLKPNQGPNKYGLDKNRTNELLRQSPDTNFDYSQLEFPIEELQNLIPRQANFVEAGEYLKNLKGKKTYKELFEEGFTRDSIDQARKRNPELTEKILFSKFATPGERLRNLTTLMNQNKKELGLTRTAKMMGDDREEAVLFDGLFRSLEPENLGLSADVDKKVFGEKFIDFMKGIDWKKQFAEDLDTIKVLDKQRIQGDKIIKEMFNDYKKRFPKQFKDLNVNDFKLQIAHNFPLRAVKGQFQGVGGLKGSSRLSFARTNILSHQEIENSFKEIINAANEQGGKLTPIQQEALDLLDKRAKKLGTVAYGKISPEGLEGDEFIKVGIEEQPGLTSLIESLENYFKRISKQKNYKPKKVAPKGGVSNLASGFVDEDIPVEIMDELKMKKGGEVKPVRMAIGGDPLANMNQQQFTPDPAFEGEDYFQQAVESGNLQAFNPGKIFKLFTKTDAVYTPKKLPDPVAEQQAAPPGTTLPTTQVVQPEDFAFQSFTLNKILDPQAPKAGTPEAWKQFLYGGGQGGKVPEAEMFDSGLEQYLDDFSNYFPDKKITKDELIDYYETSPLGNIEIKVKDARRTEPSPHSPSNDPAYKGYVGGSRHEGSGSQPLDEVGTDYREVVVKAGALPGDKKPFVSSGHYEEENVLGFTRVANYSQPDGTKVAVIQELQTDMLTKVRKEQERLQALLKRIENIKARAARELESGDPYRIASADNALMDLNAQIPPVVEESLRKHADLIKPFPNQAAKSTIPDYQKQMQDMQEQINQILQKDIQQAKPETGFQLKAISEEQQKILDSLMDLNRAGQLDDILGKVQVPATRDTDELMRYGEDTNVRGINDGTSYYSTKSLELFPPIPFNKQADYVDLLIKSTIKDAQGRGINKVAIFPPELVNQRWGKRPDSEAGKKFRDLYGKVAIQQMKNIAKKYGGDAKVEVVLNPNASDRGLTYFKRNLEGQFDFMKQDQLAQGLDPEEAQLFIDEQLNRNAHTLGDKQVIYTKEIAPGQTMDYYVDPYVVTEGEESIKKYNLVPLGPGDDRNAAQIIVEEYNPQEVQMFTITLDSDKSKAPMFMFKKKSGGTIDKDSLVSITDIYGEYGR